MTKLLVLADDFTGALDTGVQFAKAGIATSVLFSGGCGKLADYPAEALVVDLESRHDEPETAYKKVYEIAEKARAEGVKYFYKKTDSALRGNIGAELSALLKAVGAPVLEFVPAFPKNGRTTKDGIQYVSGVETAKSVFGADPFNPVRHSYIPDIIAEQSNVKVTLGETLSEPFIRVHDAATEEDLQKAADKIGKGAAMSGCAGFAEYLPKLLGLDRGGTERKKIAGRAKILLVSGSVNAITLEQLAEAAKEHKIFALSESDASIAECYTQKGCAIISSADGANEIDFSAHSAAEIEALRRETAEIISAKTERLFNMFCPELLAIFGGDTLIQTVRKLGCKSITPVCEISSGTVLCKAKNAKREFLLVSKSGGFGGKNIIKEIMEFEY
ncbi:MAG: four-carbon acid sugar kinase family protein [Synergistaceae bacterium]|nr:four-carbon acid sugar kinase family protein [Synergistaceae bacterium]